MNTFQTLSLFLAAAFIALAFLAVKVREQRNALRAKMAEELVKSIFADSKRIAAETELKSYRAQADERIAVMDENNRGLTARLSARNVTWTRPAKWMPANEVKRAFAVAADAPLWLALKQQVEVYVEDLADQVSQAPSTSLTAEARLHVAGGMEHLRLFYKQLLELHQAAQTIDADIEGEGPESRKKGGAS